MLASAIKPKEIFISTFDGCCFAELNGRLHSTCV